MRCVEDLTFGVVVPTLRRPATIDRLLASLLRQQATIKQVVIVDQSGQDTPPAWATTYAQHWPIDFVSRNPGVAAARNAGVQRLGTVDIVATADDDVWYADNSFARVAQSRIAGHHIVAGRLSDAAGDHSRWRFPATPRVMKRGDVWRCAIEPTLFYDQLVYRELGGMDEALGLGSGTPWGSGEATELLIRALKHGHSVLYDPQVVIHEEEVLRTDTEELTRVRSYARGTGRVAAMHPNVPEMVKLVAGPLIRGGRSGLRGDWPGVRRQQAAGVGRLEGLAKRCLSSTAHHLKEGQN